MLFVGKITDDLILWCHGSLYLDQCITAFYIRYTDVDYLKCACIIIIFFFRRREIICFKIVNWFQKICYKIDTFECFFLNYFLHL